MESPSIKTKHESTREDLLARLSQCSFLDPSEDKVVSQFAVRWQGVDFCLSLLLLPAPHGSPSQHVHFNILILNLRQCVIIQKKNPSRIAEVA